MTESLIYLFSKGLNYIYKIGIRIAICANPLNIGVGLR